jgi:hypothetical protein
MKKTEKMKATLFKRWSNMSMSVDPGISMCQSLIPRAPRENLDTLRWRTECEVDRNIFIPSLFSIDNKTVRLVPLDLNDN